MKKTVNDNENKRYAVDVHWVVAKCIEVYAPSREEAEMQIWDRIWNGEMCVWSDGFEATDDVEVTCSGEENEDGEIEYD